MKKTCVMTFLLTFFTHADVQQPGTGAVSRRDAETGVSCGVGEHLGGGAEAVGGDPLHRHLLLIGGIQRPGTEGPTRVNGSRDRSNRDSICPVSSPAQVRGEHVELLLLGDDRVEGRPVGSVDHVALGGRPPV